MGSVSVDLDYQGSISHWFPDSLNPFAASRTKGLSCAPRCVIFEYDLLHRSGELLHATDAFRGLKRDASVVGKDNTKNVKNFIISESKENESYTKEECT